MFRKIKLIKTRYWTNKNMNEIEMRVVNNIQSTMMMNKAII